MKLIANNYISSCFVMDTGSTEHRGFGFVQLYVFMLNLLILYIVVELYCINLYENTFSIFLSLYCVFCRINWLADPIPYL